MCVEPMSDKSVIDWQAESLRLTLFRTRPIETVIPLWETLTGQRPEKADSQPRANVITEEGPVVLGSLTHTSDPLRVNWILSPSQDQQQRTQSFPTLGSLSIVKAQFISMIADWLTSQAVPGTTRIALGSIALVINQNKASAYKQLAALLHHLQIDIENSTDLSYQINRPVNSTVQPGLIINRLSKWSAVHLYQFLIAPQQGPIRDPKTHVATRLELDINTSQHHTAPLPKDNLVPLLHEFSHIVDRISTEGDRINDNC